MTRPVWAWAMYDFANSPFPTTITSAVFNVYFAGVVARDAPVSGLTLWTFLVAASTLLAGLTGPVLGAAADIRRNRKTWLVGAALAGSAATAGLVVSTAETLLLSSILFFIASLSFTLSVTFYHSFLIDLSTPQTIGRVSGLGWALGYIGGGLCLAVNLAMIEKPGWFHLPEGDLPVRLTFLMVGIWWACFTIPVFLWTQESRGQVPAGTSVWRAAARRVIDSLRAARGMRKNLFLFLLSYFLYNDAIETVIVVAGIFAAQELGMGPGEVVGCFLMIQFVAFFGALGFGQLADRWSNKRALQASLVVWTAVLIWAAAMRTRAEFWAAGAVLALVLGGSQAVSRSLFGRMIPRGEEAQHYGFWGLSGKISAALGPLLFGVVYEITGEIRAGLLALTALLIAGQILLTRVAERSPDETC